MSKRNNRGSFFTRIIKSITEPIRKFFTPIQTETKVKETKPKGRIRKFFQGIRQSRGSTLTGTTKRVPTAKYSDYEIGWGKQKPQGAIKEITSSTAAKDIEIFGKTITTEQALELEKFVDEYNKNISELRENLIDNLHKYLDPIVAENIENMIEQTVDRDKMGFIQAAFDDLRDLDFEQFASKILESEDIDLALADSFEKMYYDLQKRYESYRESYIKVMKEEIGFSTDADELEQLIRDLPLDVFMVSYYDKYSDLTIEIWNPSPDKKGLATDETVEGRIERARDYFTRLNNIHQNS